jgi:hypothetical protein
MTPADGEKQGMCYGKDSRQVYSAYSVNGFGPIVGADPKTFVVLNANYTKDASNVGYRANAMVNADPSTFTVLGELWAKDKNSAYHRDTVIYGADPETFMALDDDHAKDANHVYDPFGKIFDQVDAKTARGIGDGKWLIDSMHVYTSNGQILDQADPKTFSDLGSGYGKDTTHIFYGDTGTFGSGKGSIIPDADRASFAVIDNNYGKDSAHIYSFGKILVGADVNTFTRVGKGPYFKDKSHVWYEGDGPGIVEIPGADAATFVLTDASTYGSAKDAFHTYGFSAKGFFYSK